MNPVIKKEILNVLRQAIDIVKEGELYKLRRLSEHMVKNAAIYQDKNSISTAVTVYSISKIYKNEVDKFVLPHLKEALAALEKGDEREYENEIKHLIQEILERYEKSNIYIQEVLERAQIKKASQMFERGISMGQVADALGISLWELMDYVGKTRIIDEFESKNNIADRMALAREMFQ